MREGNSVIRIKFNKHGLMKYVGHLDTMRYFQRVIRRSGIDAAYSEGFSPHQIMSFAQPLSVGVESNGEYFDLEVKSLTSSGEMIERMNASSAEEIEIVDMVILPEKSKKAMATVDSAEYTVYFRPGHEPDWDIYKAAELFNKSDSLRITKKNKKSEREIELKELVRSLSVNAVPVKELFPDGPLSGDRIEDPEKEVPLIRTVLSASSGDNVKPGLLIKALRSMVTGDDDHSPESNEDYPGKTDLFIIREELFDKDMKPLIEAGSSF